MNFGLGTVRAKRVKVPGSQCIVKTISAFLS